MPPAQAGYIEEDRASVLRPDHIPRLPRYTEHAQVAVRKAKRGSAPGPSGWRYERVSFSHSKDLLASISHSSHASSKSHSHTVPRSPTHTISVHTVLVCTSTYSVLYILLRIPYWMCGAKITEPGQLRQFQDIAISY